VRAQVREARLGRGGMAHVRSGSVEGTTRGVGVDQTLSWEGGGGICAGSTTFLGSRLWPLCGRTCRRNVTA